MMQFLFAALLALGLWCRRSQAAVFQTQQQAIHQYFQENDFQRKTLFLTPAQVERIEHLAKAKMESRIVTYYLGESASGKKSAVFFERQIVRSMPVTYSIAIRDSGLLDRVEILSFEEPEDYLPPLRWLRLYDNRALNDRLRIGGDIPNITGASLTSQAINDGVRRAAATFAVAVKESL